MNRAQLRRAPGLRGERRGHNAAGHRSHRAADLRQQSRNESVPPRKWDFLAIGIRWGGISSSRHAECQIGNGIARVPQRRQDFTSRL